MAASEGLTHLLHPIDAEAEREFFSHPQPDGKTSSYGISLRITGIVASGLGSGGFQGQRGRIRLGPRRVHAGYCLDMVAVRRDSPGYQSHRHKDRLEAPGPRIGASFGYWTVRGVEALVRSGDARRGLEPGAGRSIARSTGLNTAIRSSRHLLRMRPMNCARPSRS